MNRTIGAMLAVLLSAGSAADAQSVVEAGSPQTPGGGYALATPSSPESYGQFIQVITLGAAVFSAQGDATHAYSAAVNLQ